MVTSMSLSERLTLLFLDLLTSYVVCLCFGFLFFAVTDEDLTQFTSFFSTFLLVYLFDSF